MISLVCVWETSITFLAILDESDFPQFQNWGGGVFTSLCKPLGPHLHCSYREEAKQDQTKIGTDIGCDQRCIAALLRINQKWETTQINLLWWQRKILAKYYGFQPIGWLQSSIFRWSDLQVLPQVIFGREIKILRYNLHMFCSLTHHCFSLFTHMGLAEMLHQGRYAERNIQVCFTLMEQHKLRLHFNSTLILKFDKIACKIPWKMFIGKHSLIPGQVKVPLFPFNFGHVSLYSGYILHVPLFPGTLNDPLECALPST